MSTLPNSRHGKHSSNSSMRSITVNKATVRTGLPRRPQVTQPLPRLHHPQKTRRRRSAGTQSAARGAGAPDHRRSAPPRSCKKHTRTSTTTSGFLHQKHTDAFFFGQDQKQDTHVRCHGDFQNTIRSQDRVLREIGVLSFEFLLLPVQVRVRRVWRACMN